MPKFLDYNPEQVYLLPPSVRDVLENHGWTLKDGYWFPPNK